MPVTYRDLTVTYRDPGITYRGLRRLNLVRPGATVKARGRAYRVAGVAVSRVAEYEISLSRETTR